MAVPVRIITIPGSPSVPLPKLQRPRTVRASDGFSGATVADINGRAADLAFGGSAFQWVAGPAGAIAKTQVMLRGATVSGTAHAGGDLGSTNGRISAKVTAAPTTNVYLDIRKNVYEDSATSRSSYRLQIAANGTAKIQRRLNGSAIDITPTFAYAVNDVLGLDVSGSSITAYRNGALAITATNAEVTAGTLIDVVVGANTTFELDNVILEVYI